MLGLSARVTKGVQLGTVLTCVDNSGAKKLRIIAVTRYHGIHRRAPKAGVGDVVVCSVIKGDEKMRKQVVHAVVVRQKKEYRRPDGTRVAFTDNAGALVNSKTREPTGTEIRTVIAREVVERFSAIGKIAAIVL